MIDVFVKRNFVIQWDRYLKAYFCGHLQVYSAPVTGHAEFPLKSEVTQGLIQTPALQDVHHCCCHRVWRQRYSLYNL